MENFLLLALTFVTVALYVVTAKFRAYRNQTRLQDYVREYEDETEKIRTDVENASLPELVDEANKRLRRRRTSGRE